MLTPTLLPLLPVVNVCAEIVPDFTGALFVCTVTAMVCVAVRAPSLAVTVMVADPAATPVTLTVDPDTVTVAFVLSEELAV